MTTLTAAQARRFILARQGLIGKHVFSGKDGALAYVRQAGCIQFDPVDVCGRNAELTLQSRVKGFRKRMLNDLLYRDRALVDYCDKELSVLPAEDWPWFEPYRERSRALGRTFAGIPELEERALAHIRAHGPVSADTLPIEGTLYWHSSMHWSGNWSGESRAARSVLEQLYTDGALVIHHKSGTRKFYDLAERHLPAEILARPNPCPDETAWTAWRVLRRIGAVGMLWNRRSDAFLGVEMDNEKRDAAFRLLTEEGRITEVSVEGVRQPLYIRAADEPLLAAVLGGEADLRARLEFLAPLDPMLWDRKLVEALWGFRYSWEIYTPAQKRKYGYYVLPMLYGERLAGRIEAAADPAAGALTVRHVWYEPGVRETKALRGALERRLRGFAAFNGCAAVERAD